MAIALAESLIARPELDPRDLMARFVEWWQNGAYSCTGTCFDIGNTVSEALGRFKRTGNPIAGLTDPRTAGNGALMRLSPVAIRHWADRDTMEKVAALQTRTTHGAPEAIDCSIVFADMLADAIAGKPLQEVLKPRAGPFAGEVGDVAKGSWRGVGRDQIRGTGYVVDSLEAALWAVSRTTGFRTAVLLAANLGEDADTTAAITGQLAGALYGASSIPHEWLAKLAWADRIGEISQKLASAATL